MLTNDFLKNFDKYAPGHLPESKAGNYTRIFFFLGFLVLAFFMLFGCGPQKNDSSSDSATVEQQTITKGEMNAKLVDGLADIGTCDATNFRQLIYVLESSEFYYCSHTNQWSAIDIKGAKGDTGEQGISGGSGRDGAVGQNGIQGVAGKDGKDGSNGTDGENPSSLVWRHPVSEAKWFLGAFIVWLSLFSGDRKDICPTGAHSPTSTEYKDAILAGLWNQIGSALADDSTASHDKVLLGQVDIGSNQWHQNIGSSKGEVTEVNSASATNIYSVCIVD